MKRTRARSHTLLAALAIACIGAALLAACGGGRTARNDDTEGKPRSFMMGFSTLPRELNADSYNETFQLAGQHGEIVLIQRAPPWEDFLPGSDVSDITAKTTAAEKDAIQGQHLKLFFAIDPTDGATGRDRLAGLPASLAGKGFGDSGVRSAFTSYATYVALNYHPAYLALGVEMNLYFDKNRDDLDNFKSLYAETYDRVKEISPDTQVTVTFQYEDLQGLLPTQDSHFAEWPLLRAFDPRMDVTAISTYPSFYFSSVSSIPENYYSQIRGFTDQPIVIAEMGYSSAPGPQGVNGGTEPEQAAFVRRAIDEAETLSMPFVVWFAAWDPAYAQDSAFSVFQHIGLIRQDNSEKPAWSDWLKASKRPYEAP